MVRPIRTNYKEEEIVNYGIVQQIIKKGYENFVSRCADGKSRCMLFPPSFDKTVRDMVDART